MVIYKSYIYIGQNATKYFRVINSVNIIIHFINAPKTKTN